MKLDLTQVQQIQLRHRKWMMGDQENEDLQDDALDAYSRDTEMLIHFALAILNPGAALPASLKSDKPAPATYEQKAEIIRLLNDSLITRQEKTKMLLHYASFDMVRADKAIENLRQAIDDRLLGIDISTKAL